jgi:hypothetical protein
MKKFIIVAIMLLVWMPLCGFINVDYGAVINKNGTISEYVTISSDQSTLDELEITQETFKNTLSKSGAEIIDIVRLIFINKINTDESLSLEAKQQYRNGVILSAQLSEHNSLVITFKFVSAKIWQYFYKTQAETEIEFNYKFLTYDVTNNINPRTSAIETENQVYLTPQFVYNYVYAEIINQLGEEASTAIETPKYTYSYITTKKRIHTNADEQLYFNGYYYHTWEIADVENSMIKIYTTHANSVVWYLIALGLTAVFMLVIYLKSKNNKKFLINNLDEIL